MCTSQIPVQRTTAFRSATCDKRGQWIGDESIEHHKT